MIDRAPHYLLDESAGWRAASLESIRANGRLTLQPLTAPLNDDLGTFGGLENPAGIAEDRDHRVYVLDPAACLVRRFDPCENRFRQLPCIGPRGCEPRQLDSPHGLAISCDEHLYIADSGNQRVQVFSIHGLFLRSIWGPLKVVSSAGTVSVIRAKKGEAGVWVPWDIAITGREWAYVSDHANGLIHVFDPRGCWRAAWPGVVKPTRLALDQQGRLYVMQDGVKDIVVFGTDGKIVATTRDRSSLPGTFCRPFVAADPNGKFCVDGVVFDRGGTVSCGTCVLPQSSYPASGRFYSTALDSKTYRCVWDRVFIRGIVPAGAAIRVDTFTSESLKTPAEIAILPESRWSTGQLHTHTEIEDWDCLIRSAPGRYLWLRLALIGDTSVTPEIERIKIYYPRSSSLKYLPGVYRADVTSANFLDQFLSMFDRLQARTNGIVADIARYFDPSAAPSDFLPWLAGWLGMTIKSGWPVEKRRELLRNAHRLYALRGTPEGLRLHIKLYAGVEPRILEMFRLRTLLTVGHSTLGNDSTIPGESPMNRLQIGTNSIVDAFQLIDYGDPKLDAFNKYAHRFLVVVPRWRGASDADRQSLDQIIEMAKPAHTVAQFQWAQPRMRIGVQAFIGVDTVIGQYPIGVIEGQGKLGYDTVLGDPRRREKTPRITIGGNSVLK